MHIELLVEEPSAEAALQFLIPSIVGPETTFHIHTFQGKPHLLKRLPDRLKGYRDWLPPDWRIMVLIDADEQDCYKQKLDLDTIAYEAGLITRNMCRPGDAIQVFNRLAVQELEAWFFGDVEAIQSAYPEVSVNLAQQKGFRNPDTIRGGTWEALERVLQRAGYHAGGLRKIEAARQIAAHMQPQRNRSHSFRIFHHGLLELIHQGGDEQAQN